jgi:hypothetical protein
MAAKYPENKIPMLASTPEEIANKEAFNLTTPK